MCNLERDEEKNPLYADQDYFICDRDLDYSEFKRAVLGDGGKTGIEIPDMGKYMHKEKEGRTRCHSERIYEDSYLYLQLACGQSVAQ